MGDIGQKVSNKTGPVEMQRIAENNEFKTTGIVINRDQKISRDRVKTEIFTVKPSLEVFGTDASTNNWKNKSLKKAKTYSGTTKWQIFRQKLRLNSSMTQNHLKSRYSAKWVR